jgi:serine/threonine protein kinase/Flp pilus assembly protein TadD
MASAWSRGEPISAKELLARHPDMGDEAAVRLIYEEVSLRRESGQEIATTEVVNRFPRWKDELEVLLGCDRMLRPFSRVALFPKAGEDLGPFRLIEELGRGASGKTYLAAQPALLDRLVVLKVITDDQEEHLSLARFQHTHIIPLFSEQTFPERGLRALCMPYFGGTSLARILEELAEICPAARRGRDLVEALDRVQSGRAAPSICEGPYRRYLEQASYVAAVCWVAACLADALQSAHSHGLIHMDVKPSNILIAGDGLPMLLDFHLAHRPIVPGEQVTDRLGGTTAWMAPEHRAAFESVAQGRAVSEAVDARADLYALGLVLREALAGPDAAREDGAAGRWRRCNLHVSRGLADIVEKCLAPHPGDRYESAAALAEDLRRHLHDLPLRGVPNRSVAERWRKWRRRRPAALARSAAWLTTLATVAVTLLLAQAYYHEGVRVIEAALHDGRKFRNDGRFLEAVHTLSRGLDRAGGLPAVDHLKSSLRDQLDRARREQQASALHDLAELIRFRYGVDLPTAEEARPLVRNILAIWNQRDLRPAPPSGSLDPRTEQMIRTDLLDLAIICAELQVRLAPPASTDAARRGAIRLLELAQGACGSSPRLDRLRRSLAAAPADSGDLPDPAKLTALDHYDLGRSFLRGSRFREADLEFQQVLDERPQDFWPNFYQGLCAYRLGRFHGALAAFRTCIALAPNSAECFHNRARAAEALEWSDLAAHDYTRALELDPALTSALLNRGIINYKKGRHDAAIADFRQAIRSTPDSRTLGLIHYNLALALLARGDRTLAQASAQDAVARGNDAARGLLDRISREP